MLTRFFLMCVVAQLAVAPNESAFAFAKSVKKNVLFIAVDDLRPELGCYGATQIHSPNIDRFAKSALRFERAYCQQAVCNPSRTSLMTGLRPDTIGVTGNHSHFRSKHPDVVTLPQHFKNHGYHAAAIGKLYHGVFPDGASITKWDTMGDPQSWSVPAIRFGPRYYYTEQGISAAKETFAKVYKPKNPAPDDWTKKLVFGPATEAPDVADNILYDGQVADAAIDTLQDLKRKPDQPFFLAVGFIKPHSPYISPKKYFELYDDVDVAKVTSLPDGSPKYAGHNSGELRRYTDQPKQGSIETNKQRRVRHAYYACVSYIDAQIGQVLDELDRLGLSENTIVSLYGDHGYHLGEQGLWGKTTNFELDTRVPLFIRNPGMKATGQSTSSLVELVDLYPTLAELTGLPVGSHLEGTSLARLLDDPQISVKDAALSQYPRGRELMGYSMRTATHRLTQWVHRSSGDVRASELYDYRSDELETKNIANESPKLKQKLANQFALVSPMSFSPIQNADKSLSGGSAAAAESAATGFEKAKLGEFTSLNTSAGTWKTTEGKVLIDNKHAATGRQCLQLAGGEKSVVELTIADGTKTDGNLTFKAERWTKRTPFSFRIEKSTTNPAEWKEIYNGDQQIKVGRPFLSSVDIALADPAITKLRFTVVSPPNTGILIDDLKIAEARPQTIQSVEAVPFALPALIGKRHCPLVKLKIETTGRINPVSIKDLTTSLIGTDRNDISEVQAIFSGSNSNFSSTKPFDSTTELSGKIQLVGNQQLLEGTNYIWVACTLKNSANIDHRVGGLITDITFSNGRTVAVQQLPSVQQMGVAVRQAGDDNVHTYRIPGLATTKKGSLIAVYDVRNRSGGDLPGDIDVGMSRSIDGGRTWQTMKVIMDQGEDPDFRYDGIGDPTVMVDSVTGTIWCAATWSHGNRSWRGSGPGLTPDETGQFMLVKSDDDGVTWSKPINITKQVKKPEWCFLLQGPGKGITMADGTIVFPAQYQDPPNTSDKVAHRLPHAAFIFSKDHGKTWDISTGAYDDTTESQVIETTDGQLMLNCRYNRESRRVVMTTDDMGKTWNEHPTNRSALVEPSACMASIINVGRELRQLGKGGPYANRNDVLLFSNPDSTNGRNHITIKASLDGGKTWPVKHHLLLDEQNGRGYSCMTMIDADTVGIIYEGSQADMTFQRVKLADILSPPKNQKTKNPLQTAFKAVLRDIEEPAPEFRFARVFGHHMVMQADQPIRVWGHAKPSANVTVFLGQTEKRIRATADGTWRVEFPARPVNSNPIALSANSNGKHQSLSDILIGEVWLCAGQSNMEWPVSKSSASKQTIGSSNDKQIRLMNFTGVARGGSGVYDERQLSRLTADKFSRGEWQVSSPRTAAPFSAVGYYFGRKLRKELDCPIGLINVSIGGTPIESWVDTNVLAQHPDLKRMVNGNWLDNPSLDDWCKSRGRFNLKRAVSGELHAPADQFGPNHSFKPGFMYHAGILPFAPMSIRGVLWYQGESNGDNPKRAKQYDAAFPLLVNSWRTAFQNGNMPFAFVQLPAMGRANWPVFREYQRRSLDRLSNVGMAVTIDTGDRGNVHPLQKKPVGERLAAWALAKTYDRSGPSTGPLFRSKRTDGQLLTLTFETEGDRLSTSDGQSPNNFEVAGSDGVFHPAVAKLSEGQIVVSSRDVSHPVDVRYAWKDFPEPRPNLVNSIGLPASPFTTLNDFVRAADNKDARPNILLIVSEDNGPELGCYGDTFAKTPNLDRLASDGIRFETAYVTQSVCSPSRGTIFTGLYPHQNGQIGLATHQFEMFKAWPTTYSILKQAGYTTGLLGKIHVNPPNVIEEHVDFRRIKSSNFAKKNLHEYADASAEFINAADKPFFLTVNFPDAHWPVQNRVQGRPKTIVPANQTGPMPYIGFDNPRLREHLTGFYNCMSRLDECVGELLTELDKSGKADNTLVIYIGDHGAQFARGKVFVTEGGLRIPFIVRWPGRTKPGIVSKQMVSTVDLLPTIVTAAGAKVPHYVPGKDLAPILRGEKIPIRQYLFGERNCDSADLHFPQRAIRDERFKLIKTLLTDRPDPGANKCLVNGASNFRGSPTYAELKTAPTKTQTAYKTWLNPPEYQLYDLKADRHEFTNLADDPKYTDIKQRLIDRLQQWQVETDDGLRFPGMVARLTKENDDCRAKKIRSPKGGWQYVNYLAPKIAKEQTKNKPTTNQPEQP